MQQEVVIHVLNDSLVDAPKVVRTFAPHVESVFIFSKVVDKKPDSSVLVDVFFSLISWPNFNFLNDDFLSFFASSFTLW